MLPNFGNILSVSTEVELEKTKTFGININDNTIGGMIDGLDALQQAIYLILSIEADQHIIYPYNYGISTLDLIGKPVQYVAAVISDRIKEALLTDDRITDVSDFEFESSKNKLHVTFIVHTIYGNINTETVVNY